MNFRQIEAFRAVMVSGTVTGASKLLHVSQPAVSRLIADLERSTDLSLFVREKRRLHPTPEAVTLLSEVEHAFTGLEILKRKARDIRNYNTGNVRVIANPALAMGFLPTACHQFLEKHPKVAVSLQTHNSTIVREWVAAQQFDLGLAFGTEQKDGIKTEPFAKVTGVCVMHAEHPLVGKKIIEPSDLEGQSLVALPINDPTRQQLERLLDEGRVNYVINIETQLAAVACAFVLDDLGVSVINPFTAWRFQNLGLVVKPFEPAIEIEFQLVLPEFRPMSTLAKSFIKTLHEHRDETLRIFKKLKWLS